MYGRTRKTANCLAINSFQEITYILTNELTFYDYKWLLNNSLEHYGTEECSMNFSEETNIHWFCRDYKEMGTG